MLQIKQLNADYLQVRKSGYYRLGFEIRQTASMIKKGEFGKIRKEFSAWRAEKKVKRKEFPGTKCTSCIVKGNFFSDSRIAIYTCIWGAYDDLIEPDCVPDNCDYFAITDREVPEGSAWKKLDVSAFSDRLAGMTNAQINRYFKMMPHLLFPDYEYSIYVDGNVEIVSDLT